MFSQYALNHAWLIPLLPAAAFVLSGLLRRVPALAAAISICCSLVSLALALGTGYGVLAQGITVESPLVSKAPWFTVPGFSVDMGVYIDPLSAMMLVVVTLVAFVVQIYSVGYMYGDAGMGRFYAYLSLFAAAMLGLVLAVNFVQLFVFWELVGLCSYLLIGYYFHKISAREAAKKAFMTTRIGDFGLLIGIVLLQLLFGTLDFGQLGVAVPTYVLQHGTGLLTVAALLVLLGPVGKSGQFPLHVWLPDAMEGPTPVSALIHAATMVVAGVYLVARAFFLFSVLPNVLEVIAWLGAFTACFAASIAFTQRDLKRILAYSTISQLGLMMLALGVGSVTASLFHLMTHAFFKALLFLAAGAVLHGLPNTNDIFAMGGLRHKMPVTFAAMTVGVLAIAGIPPFAGFFSKDEILLAVSQVSLPLYVIAVATSVMTAFYMARLLFVVFCGPEKPGNIAHEAPLSMRLALLVLGLLSVLGGYVPYAAQFGDWVRFGPAVHAGLDWAIAGPATLLSAAAIGLAWLIYGRGSISASSLARRFSGLYNLSLHKYYIDELYLWLNRTFVDGFGRILYWLELNVVEGMIQAMARLFGQLGSWLRRGQSGNLQRYGLVMFGAVLLVMAWLLIDPLFKGILARGGIEVADFPLLTAILLTPVLGMLLLVFLPSSADRAIKLTAAASMTIVLGLTLYAYWAYDTAAGGMQFTEHIPWIKELGVNYALGVDGISLPLLLLTVLVGFAAVFVSWNINRRPKEFFIQLLLLIIGAVGTFVSRDLFIFLLFYELAIIPSYIMVLVWGTDKRVSREYAGMKLTLYLLLGSAFMLAGVIALFLYAYPDGMRTFSMEALAQAHLAGNLAEPVQIVVFLLLLLGFGSTLSMWPFYSWAPDGYAAAPTGVAMIHAGVLKKVGAYGLIRLGLLVLPAGVKFWAPLIALLAVANVLYGAFVALAQKDLKYMIAYSSVSHIGYILLGFAALNIISLDGAVANMFAHGIMSALFFAMAGLVYDQTGTRHIPDLGGLAHQMPRVAVGLLLAGMSSLGLPGLVGFVPELTIFVGAFSVYPVYTLLAISGIIFTALYILRVLADVLFGPRRQEFDGCRDAGGVELVPLLVLGSALIAFGVFPHLLMGMVNGGMEPALAVLGGVFQ